MARGETSCANLGEAMTHEHSPMGSFPFRNSWNPVILPTEVLLKKKGNLPETANPEKRTPVSKPCGTKTKQVECGMMGGAAESTTAGPLRIGVLALQGAFREHIEKLKELPGVEPVEVRTPAELESVAGLIVPGGESTAIALIAEASGLLEPLRAYVRRSDKAVWGTCAGLIMMSDHVEGQKEGGQAVLGGLKVTTVRNYFGRQLDSFVADSFVVPMLEDGERRPFPAVFIRAPVVTAVHSPEVEILASVPPKSTDNKHKEVFVAVRQGHLLGTSFHPELTNDSRWHQFFVDMVKRVQNESNEKIDVETKAS